MEVSHLICAIYDKAIEAYTRPFYVTAVGEALRMFEDEVARPESPMHGHPEDYALFQVGTWDQRHGDIQGMEVLCLARAHELVSVLTREGESKIREVM